MIVMELPEENINSCLHERATEDNHSRNVVLRVKLKADNEDGGRSVENCQKKTGRVEY